MSWEDGDDDTAETGGGDGERTGSDRRKKRLQKMKQQEQRRQEGRVVKGDTPSLLLPDLPDTSPGKQLQEQEEGHVFQESHDASAHHDPDHAHDPIPFCDEGVENNCRRSAGGDGAEEESREGYRDLDRHRGLCLCLCRANGAEEDGGHQRGLLFPLVKRVVLGQNRDLLCLGL